MQMWTIGHGTADGVEVARLLRDAGVSGLVDVRRHPGSRRHPAVGRDVLAGVLPEHGVAYRWDERLGGRRPCPPDSPDSALRNRAFAGYAAHMRTAGFTEAVAELLRTTRPTAVMCSESVWWRCHRRLVADHLQLVHGVVVHHLFHDGRTQLHPPTQGVRLDAGRLVYDAGQETLPMDPDPDPDPVGS